MNCTLHDDDEKGWERKGEFRVLPYPSELSKRNEGKSAAVGVPIIDEDPHKQQPVQFMNTAAATRRLALTARQLSHTSFRLLTTMASRQSTPFFFFLLQHTAHLTFL